MSADNGQQVLPGFEPFAVETNRSMMARKWLDEEDELLNSMMEQAYEQNLDIPAVYVAISDKLNNLAINTQRNINRTPKAVEVRYNVKGKKYKSSYVKRAERPPVDEDSLDALLGKLKSTIKERRDSTNWREKYEEIKAEHDKLVKDHEKLINTVRRLVDTDE